MVARILVVDDDEAIREFVTALLRDEGYSPFIAENGAIALNVLQEINADLIILDMRMPIMDGGAFLRAYSSFPRPHAPIIAASANAQSVTEITEDVVSFIDKPFNIDDLLVQIEKYIKVKPSAHTDRSQ